MSNLLGEPYQALYKDYYADGQVAEKRLLSARDALAHIKTFTGEERFGRVVDVGAGEGSLLQLLNVSSMADQLYALEISESGQHAVTDRKLSSLVECKSFDGYSIPYPDQFFDRLSPFTCWSTSSMSGSCCASFAGLRGESSSKCRWKTVCVSSARSQSAGLLATSTSTRRRLS